MNQKVPIKTIKNSPFSVRLAAWILQRRGFVCGIGLLLLLGLGAGIKKLSFNNNYELFFEEDNPQVLALNDLQNKYNDAVHIFIGLEVKKGDVFTNQALAAIEDLVTRLWQTPYSTRIDGLTNFQYTKATGDELFVGDLVENAITKTPQELATIRQFALNDPAILHRLINESGIVTGINIELNVPPNTPNSLVEISTFVRNELANFKQRAPNFNTYLTGMGMLAISFQEAARWDLSRLIPLMILVIIVVLWLFLRSVSAALITLFILSFSIITALGVAGWMKISLTVVSLSSITIIMTLAVADCVHLLVTIVQYSKQGKSKKAAIIESLKLNFTPVFITSLTTIIGFLSLNFSDAPPFRDLGNIVATGMFFAFLGAIFLLPALLSLLPYKVSAPKEKMINYTFFPLHRLADFIILNYKRLLVFSCLPIIGLSFLAFQNDLSDEFVKYFDEAIPFRPATDFISENLTGIYNVDFSINSGTSGGINDPVYLERLDAFSTWLKTQKEVIHVATYSSIVKRVNKSIHNDDPAYYKLPHSRAAASQYLFLFEMSLPFGLDINNQIDIDKTASRLKVSLTNLTSLEVIAFTGRAENWLVENCPNPAMHALGVSPTLMFAQMTRQQIYSLLYGIGTALFIITFVLIIIFRSIRYGLVSLIPNIIPITVGFGVWAMVNGTINMGTSIVFGMVLGIIVDDTVHFMVKYLRAKKELNYTSKEAVRYAFATVGQALIVTTIILGLGFLVLGQSLFNLNSEMAYLTVIIILLALVVDFMVLPALLLWIDKTDDSIERIS